MRKREPIVIHGMLHDSTNYKALIEAQASMPSLASPNEEKAKVKSLGKMKTNYKRTTNK